MSSGLESELPLPEPASSPAHTLAPPCGPLTDIASSHPRQAKAGGSVLHAQERGRVQLCALESVSSRDASRFPGVSPFPTAHDRWLEADCCG